MIVLTGESVTVEGSRMSKSDQILRLGCGALASAARPRIQHHHGWMKCCVFCRLPRGAITDVVSEGPRLCILGDRQVGVQ